MKVADAEKQKYYDDRIHRYEANIQRLVKHEAAVLEECRLDTESAAVKLFELSNEMLNLASNYLALNGIARSVLGMRDEESLSEARKSITKSIIYLENVVTKLVDASFFEYERKLAELSSVPPERKYYVTKKIGAAIALLKYHYGDNTKWYWSFVDIEARFTAVAKNLLDLKKAYSNNNPSSEDYEPLLYHLRMVKDLLAYQANRFHERYSLSSKRPDDLRSAIAFLSALKQILVILNERREAEEIRKKHDAWQSAYNAMLKR
ncbi:MAG: hypothetical protein LBC77_05145 [Spirochaetaceae bacterium]|jgi:hypothetical protein|nr:hypothetical protein [Spirochaetaceae bacterium]